MARIVAFSGLSNSGKTTLIEKLVLKVKESGKRAFVIKHDPKDKAQVDTEGKDSDKFFKAGADVALCSPKKTTLFLQDSVEIAHFVERFLDWDYVFIEGLRELDFPRIVVARDVLDEGYLKLASAFAFKNIDYKGERVLDLDDINGVLEWINQNIKES